MQRCFGLPRRARTRRRGSCLESHPLLSNGQRAAPRNLRFPETWPPQKWPLPRATPHLSRPAECRKMRSVAAMPNVAVRGIISRSQRARKIDTGDRSKGTQRGGACGSRRAQAVRAPAITRGTAASASCNHRCVRRPAAGQPVIRAGSIVSGWSLCAHWVSRIYAGLACSITRAKTGNDFSTISSVAVRQMRK